jgi:phage shock protein A
LLKAQIHTALQQQREDLAEAGTSELVGIEDRIPIIESLIASTQEEEQELNRYLSGLRSKRDEMERDLQLIKERKTAESSSVSVGSTAASDKGNDVDRRVERAGNAIARVKSSLTGVPPSADLGNAASRAELEDLHRKNRIAERLAALKKES